MKELILGGVICLLSLGVVLVSGAVLPRASSTSSHLTPDSSSTPDSSTTHKPLDHSNNRSATVKPVNEKLSGDKMAERSDKTSNSSAIGESIKMVASQLLQGSKTPPPTTGQGGIVADVRTPPRMKNQQTKNKVAKPVEPLKPAVIENSNAGIAIPMNMDDLEHSLLHENKTSNIPIKETSTTDEGLSTWILLSGNPTTASSNTNNKHKINNESNKKPEKNSSTVAEDKKQTLESNKPKPSAKPTRSPSIITMKPTFVRKPVAIGSSNKSDLIASGSAVNENVMNKIKASVLASIQKNKNAALNKTVIATTSAKPILIRASPTTTKINKVEVTTKPSVKPTLDIKNISTTTVEKNENKAKLPDSKQKVNQSNKLAEVLKTNNDENNDISVEAKHVEIELEVSTPAPSTTKKPKRSSNKRKKNKHKTRKTASTTPKPIEASPESKVESNNTKAATKNPPKDKPITTQIYNYLSREVMPSVGVGLVSLAGIVGLASYLFYPFGGVVRRAYDINDRKDDLYQQNDEQYASDGGQREEEMLGSLFPENSPETHNKIQPINPYAGQTQFTYPQAKPLQDQNIRHRNVGYGSDQGSFVSSDRVGQQNKDAFHGSAYSEHIHYDTHSSENDRFSPYQQPQPVYKSLDRQTENPGFLADSGQHSYNNPEGISDPVYEYGQAMRYSQEMITDTTKHPVQETLHLGAQDVIEQQKETGYTVDSIGLDENKQPQFVVGNIPKELIQAVTPVSVPEHGPRSLKRRRRNVALFDHDLPMNIESAAESLREILRLRSEASEYNTPDTAHITLLQKRTENKKIKSHPKKYFNDKIKNKHLPKNIDINLGKIENHHKIARRDTEKSSQEEIEDSMRRNVYYVHAISESTLDKKPFNIKFISEFPSYASPKNISKKSVGDDTELLPKISSTDVTLFNTEIKQEQTTLHNDRDNEINNIEANTISSSGNVNIHLDNPHMRKNLSSLQIEIVTEKPLSNPETNKNDGGSVFIDFNNLDDKTYVPEVTPEDVKPTTPKYEEPLTPSTTLNTVTTTDGPPESYSIIDFLRTLIEFKFQIGMGILRGTTNTLGRYLSSIEMALQATTTMRPSKFSSLPLHIVNSTIP